jgi:hypothetical protein
MSTGDAIELLLGSDCPSLQARTRVELLHEATSSPVIRSLQAGILDDALVRRVLGWRQPDGWLASDFHGRDSLETGVRVLCEKGLDRGHPVLVGALLALERHPERTKRGLGAAGAVLDRRGLGGARTISATVFATAGQEDRAIVADEVRGALAAFEAVLAVDVIEDLVEDYRGRLVYRPGRAWPSVYHLRLLAATRGWRSAGSRTMVAQAVARLCRLSPIPHALLREGSRLVAPASFAMDAFACRLDDLSPAGWMAWFHRMELLSRLGIVSDVPELQDQVGQLQDILDAGGGRFDRRIEHPFFRDWGAYTGLMLEADWRSPTRRICDLTFRSLLILHHAGSSAVETGDRRSSVG